MARYRSLLIAALAAAVCGGAWLGWSAWRRWIALVRLDTVRPEYLHYDFIELRLRARDPGLLSRWRESPPRAVVLRGGAPVRTVAGIREVELRWDPVARAFLGRWPCPWNAPAGEYLPALTVPPGPESRLDVAPFRIAYRKPHPLPRRLVVLTFESVAPLAAMKVRAPDGQLKDWRGLLDWARYMEADALWVLGGQTPGHKDEEVWLPQNLPMIPKLAEECRRRGLLFGVYAMCYLTMSKRPLPRYRYALEVHDGRPVPTRAISIADPRRPGDVAALLQQWQKVPGVDFLGLDYIRNPLGGYELADEFFAEMPGVRPPPEWPRLSPDERMVWFARKKILRLDKAFIDAWQWWRARRVALIVRRIRAEIGWDKPLWAFTLTWDKGWHHGQDPVMMNDAGVDADALMLYEANAAQFDYMMKEWSAYVGRSDAQLLVGDVVDWPLHQRSPLGPGEFLRRLSRAMDGVYRDGPARGIFVHDLARALHGRLGPYSTLQWMDAAREASRRFHSMPEPRPRAGGGATP